MHGVYNAETLERLTDTVHHLHNATTLYEKLFAGRPITGITPSYIC